MKFGCRIGWHSWEKWETPEPWTRTTYPNFMNGVWITGQEIKPIESHFSVKNGSAQVVGRFNIVTYDSKRNRYRNSS